MAQVNYVLGSGGSAVALYQGTNAERLAKDPEGLPFGSLWLVTDVVGPPAPLYQAGADPAQPTGRPYIWRPVAGAASGVTAVTGQDGIQVTTAAGVATVRRLEAGVLLLGNGAHLLPAGMADVYGFSGATEGLVSLPPIASMANLRTRTLYYADTAGALAIAGGGGATIGGLPSLVLYGGGAVTLRPDLGTNDWQVVALRRGTSTALVLYVNAAAGLDTNPGFLALPLATVAAALRRADEAKWTETCEIRVASATDDLAGVVAIPCGLGPAAGPCQILGAPMAQLAGPFDATAATDGSTNPATPATVEVANDPSITDALVGEFLRFTAGAAAAAGAQPIGSVTVDSPAPGTTTIQLAGVYDAVGAVPGDAFVVETPAVALGSSTRLVSGSGNRLFVQNATLTGIVAGALQLHANAARLLLAVTGGAVVFAGRTPAGFSDVVLEGTGAALVGLEIGLVPVEAPGIGVVIARGCLVEGPAVDGSGSLLDATRCFTNVNPSNRSVFCYRGGRIRCQTVFTTNAWAFIQGGLGTLLDLNYRMVIDSAVGLNVIQASDVVTAGLFGSASGAGTVGMSVGACSRGVVVFDDATGLVGDSGNDYRVGANAAVDRATFMAGGTAVTTDIAALDSQLCTIQRV